MNLLQIYHNEDSNNAIASSASVTLPAATSRHAATPMKNIVNQEMLCYS